MIVYLLHQEYLQLEEELVDHQVLFVECLWINYILVKY